MNNIINITIDGPVASGKGTVAKGLAARLGIPTLNTGAIYRGVTVWLLEAGMDINDEKKVIMALPQIDMRVFVANGDTKIFLADKDITDKLYKNDISRQTAVVSAYPSVRDFVNEKIGEIASKGSFIIEGRDIGTTVLPRAKYKFFLTASMEERARRRMAELKKKGEDMPFVDVLIQVKERDEADMNRKVSPLKQAPDAVLIDSTDMSAEQVIDTIAKYIKL
jgi:cytidylate kinase